MFVNLHYLLHNLGLGLFAFSVEDILYKTKPKTVFVMLCNNYFVHEVAKIPILAFLDSL